jgi:hypothetical protein
MAASNALDAISAVHAVYHGNMCVFFTSLQQAAFSLKNTVQVHRSRMKRWLLRQPAVVAALPLSAVKQRCTIQKFQMIAVSYASILRSSGAVHYHKLPVTILYVRE